MFEVGLASVCEEINDAFRNKNHQRVENLLWPALDQFNDMPQLWFYAGNIFFQTGRPALAALCFEKAIELDENPLVLANLGASYRRLNHHEDGLAVLNSALERHPNYEPALVNLGAMYVNEGCPEKGIPPLEKAVALGKAKGKLETGAEWNLGLLYLEAGRFGEGFDIYRNGYGAERLVRTYAHGDVPEPDRLEPSSHECAVRASAADQARPTLLVWGEQGIGDELMFGTILNDAIEHYEIVFECHPRLEKLHRNSTWARSLTEQGRQVRIYPTRKETQISWPVTESIRADYKCPIGDLASFYRRDLQSFKDAWDTGPTYTYNVPEAESYRQQLIHMAGDKPIVGLAIHGGVLTTARQYRTLKIPEIEYLFDNTDCVFVSLDYDDMTPFMLHLEQKYPGRFKWIPSIVQHWDWDHTAALLAATDMNVVVCQSAAHLSAGIGAPTRVLAPKRVAWREVQQPALGKDVWYWWPGDQIKLYTQDDPESWRGPLDRVIADIKALEAA
jgi:tetratricopeptide (TPR) repeat protein